MKGKTRYCVAMSEENVEAIRAAYEQYYSRGEFGPFLEAITEDFEFVTATEMPDAGTYRGPKAHAWIRTYIESFDEFTQEATEVLDAGGEKVVAAVLQRGRPRGSGAPVESRWWQVVTFRDGVVARVEMFSQREDAFEAAGLRE